MIRKITNREVIEMRLLSKEEFFDGARTGKITPIKRNWWLKDGGKETPYGASVTDDNGVLIGTIISDDDIGLRPVIVLKNKYDVGDKLKFIGVTWKVIANQENVLALCDDILLATYFDEITNEYENSHIKNVIDAIYNVSAVI